MIADKSHVFAHYWQMLAPSDAPVPLAEYRFAVTRRWRFDFAFPAHYVAVEVDGGQFTHHGGRHATDADRHKLNVAAADGWRIFRFSPQQLEANPVACVALVARAVGIVIDVVQE